MAANTSGPFPAPGDVSNEPEPDEQEGPETSYTALAPTSHEMSKAGVASQASSTNDVDAIGSHCSLPLCHVLDYLPFRCESCHAVFCLEHRTETAHECPHPGAWARRRAEQQRQRDQQLASAGPSKTALRKAEAAARLRGEAPPPPTECCLPSCRETINRGLKQGIRCDICTRSYCLRHRLPEEHECEPPRSVREAEAKAGKKAMMDRFREWSAARTTRMLPAGDGKRRKAGQAAARTKFLADLKREAKGDAKLAPEKRLYLVVEAEALPEHEPSGGGAVDDAGRKDPYHAASVPSRKMFVGRDWKVGRVLDCAARELAVENRNNLGGGEADRLRVFHVEGGRLLAFAETVGDGVGAGDTLVLLRGAGSVDG